ELRIGGQRRVGVSRHVDLGDDGDETLGRIGDDVLVLRLGVEAAGPATNLGAAAVQGQLWPAVDDDAPALVVGQVQVQVVDLVQRDLVQVRLDRGDRVEVPRDVEHRAPVRETGM